MTESKIPTFEDLLWPTLKALDKRGGTASIQELSIHVATDLALSDDILQVLHKDGPQSEVDYRAAWARTHLKFVGAVDNASRGIWKITEVGRGIQTEIDVRELVLLERADRHRRRKNPTASQSPKDSGFSILDVAEVTDLRELNQLLTAAMSERKIQALIKDDNLDLVIESVLEFTADSDQQLLAAAILGRLAAVARGRESRVYDRADEVLTQEPISIETLDDGEAKTYAALMLARISNSWISQYSYREAMTIDTADTARRELLSANLAREESISDWVSAITEHAAALKGIGNEDSRLKRIRRIFAAMRDVAARWRGDVGTHAGVHLAECLDTFLSGKLRELEQAVLHEALDNLLSILGRIIEMRFSMALYASTYALVERGKKKLGPGLWGSFLGQSALMPEVRGALLESALVLARQNRSDKQIMAVLIASYTSRPQVAGAIRRHLQNARDLDPDVAEWWYSAGDISDTQRKVEHKVGNTEDSQIGALLIEVEYNREAMDKVGRAVVPLLEISEPILASTVKKAVLGYRSIAQTARRLSRMRKLTKTELKGERLEYNPLEHEMLGGHQAGVRRVKVVRDGIKKEFSGKIKTLVKPWVEPDQE